MSSLMSTPPFSACEPVTEMIHGVPVTDPYRWLENADSPQTRRWIERQTEYARAYLDHIPGRDSIRKRIHEFLAVETYDSFQMAGTRYFFRKRLPTQEQPCIYMRDASDGPDQLLLDPSEGGNGPHTALKPVRVSPDGRLLGFQAIEQGQAQIAVMTPESGNWSVLTHNRELGAPAEIFLVAGRNIDLLRPGRGCAAGSFQRARSGRGREIGPGKRHGSGGPARWHFADL